MNLMTLTLAMVTAVVLTTPSGRVGSGSEGGSFGRGGRELGGLGVGGVVLNASGGQETQEDVGSLAGQASSPVTLPKSKQAGGPKHSALGGANALGYRLGFFKDHLSLINGRDVVERYPLQDPLGVKPKVLSFRRDQMFVVWDERGLTINNGRTAVTTRLERLPVSPRLRKKEDIRVCLDEKWDLGANAVSGGRRIGSFVYFVARWQRPTTTGPVIWLEALVRVNLDSSTPKPEALAVVDGVSFSAAMIEDNLTVSGQKLVLPVHKSNEEGTPEWGVWTYDTADFAANYTHVGSGIKYAKALADGSIGFIEKTALGSYVVGTVDPSNFERHEEFESYDRIRFVDNGFPAIVTATGSTGSVSLHWIDDGRMVVLPAGASVRRGRLAVVVWVGAEQPVKAWAYGSASGNVLARWNERSAVPVVESGADL